MGQVLLEESSLFPAVQRSNLRDGVLRELTEYAEAEGVPHHVAFAAKVIDWLGHELPEQMVRVDAAKDGGVDYYRFDDNGVQIIQSKSKDFLNPSVSVDRPIGPDCLADIGRIVTLLKTADEPARAANHRLRHLLKQLQAELRPLQEAVADGNLSWSPDLRQVTKRESRSYKQPHPRSRT
jgi:hypothetical protein